MFPGKWIKQVHILIFSLVPEERKLRTAEMLLRMYLRWEKTKGFKTELVEVSPGEVAGIKAQPLNLMVTLLTDG